MAGIINLHSSADSLPNVGKLLSGVETHLSALKFKLQQEVGLAGFRLKTAPTSFVCFILTFYITFLLRGLSPQANYTDRATAACQRS
jgi:hypothetical protein